MFKKIFNLSKESKRKNIENIDKLTTEKSLTNEQKVINNLLLEEILYNPDINYKYEIISDEVKNFIKSNKFDIKYYEKKYDEYYNKLSMDNNIDRVYRENIYVCYNNWIFCIKIFRNLFNEKIYEFCYISNVNTKEVVEKGIQVTILDYENTNAIIKLLNSNSYFDYINEKYKMVFKFKDTLCELGYKVNMDNLKFDIDKVNGYLKIDDICIYFYMQDNDIDELNIVFSQDIYNNCNITEENIEYEFKYSYNTNSEEIKMFIQKFSEHINGQYGYCEEGIYYNKENIIKFINTFKLASNLHNNVDNTFVRLERINDDFLKNKINKHAGIELYEKIECIFDINPSININKEINQSRISIIYDKNKSNNCIMYIENYIYTEQDEHKMYLLNRNEKKCRLNDNETYPFYNYEDYEIDSKFLTDKIKVEGTFLYIIDKLKEYLFGLFEIYGIKLDKSKIAF